MKQQQQRLDTAYKRIKPPIQPIYKCYFSDGRVENLCLMQALFYGRGRDENMCLYEPYIFKCELVSGRGLMPKLCDVLEQIIESNAETAKSGNIHSESEVII